MSRNMYIFYPGGLTYERGEDASGTFWIKPLKETNLGVGLPFLTFLLQLSLVIGVIEDFDYMNELTKYISSRATLKETFTA